MNFFTKALEATNENATEPFFDFFISVSRHVPYVRERYELNMIFGKLSFSMVKLVKSILQKPFVI